MLLYPEGELGPGSPGEPAAPAGMEVRHGASARRGEGRDDRVRSRLARDPGRLPRRRRRALPQGRALGRRAKAPSISTSSPTARRRSRSPRTRSRSTSVSSPRPTRSSARGTTGTTTSCSRSATTSRTSASSTTSRATTGFGERSLIDEVAFRQNADLLPHEFVHSWNGKYRRPAGLATPDFQQPMKGEMLWVYEGLTEYLGEMLTPRSGLWTPDVLARPPRVDRGVPAHLPGRTWRPLRDTTVAAQLLYNAPRRLGGAPPRRRLLRRGRAHLARGRRPHPPADEGRALARRLLPQVPRARPAGRPR